MTQAPSTQPRYDVVVAGGGHNGLVAAAYLARAGALGPGARAPARAGRRRGEPAGLRGRRRAAVGVLRSGESAAGPDRRRPRAAARLPTASVASYTATVREGRPAGLLVERDEGPATANLVPAADRLGRRVRRLAAASTDGWRPSPRISPPTLTEPLLSPADLHRAAAGPRAVARPAGAPPRRRRRRLPPPDDVVRGVALTDGLIGTFADVHAADGLAGPLLPVPPDRQRHRPLAGAGRGHGRRHRCDGGGGPARGRRAAFPGRRSPRWKPRADGVTVHWTDEDGARCGRGRGGTSSPASPPACWQQLTGADPGPSPAGSQLKVNMVLARLPRLRSGADPATAFAGTFHVDEAAGPARRRLRAGGRRPGCPTSSRSRSTATR